MNTPLSIEMNTPQQPRQSWRWLPRPSSCFKALCLMPLAIPGVRVVMSGLSWFSWLNFPLSWLVAAMMFVTLHILLPMILLASMYYGARYLFASESARSLRSACWFAATTLAIVVLAFMGTVGTAALAEVSICRLPQITVMIGSCSNHFINSNITDLVASIDTYNFRYYNWLVWLVIAAYLYHIESHIRPVKLSPTDIKLVEYAPENFAEMHPPNPDQDGESELIEEVA